MQKPSNYLLAFAISISSSFVSLPACAERVGELSQVTGGWVNTNTGQAITIEKDGNASSDFGNLSVMYFTQGGSNIRISGSNITCDYDITLVSGKQSVWKLVNGSSKCLPTGLYAQISDQGRPTGQTIQAFNAIDWLTSHTFCYSGPSPATFKYSKRHGNDVDTLVKVALPGLPGTVTGIAQVISLGGKRFLVIQDNDYFDLEAASNDDLILHYTNAAGYPFTAPRRSC